jgi:hypothetical protein
MRTLLWIGIVLGVFLCGCTDSSRRVIGTDDVVPPSEPRDVWSITGDGAVTLYWSAPLGEIVRGYSVFISQNDLDYYRVGDVGPDRHHFDIDGETLPPGVPFDFVNGNTYFLGVSSFDAAGNESELTESSTTFDTPRPSGRGLQLYRADGPRASESGYDFSRSPFGYAMSGSSLFTDVYFASEGGVPVLRTPYPQVVEMQDMGRLDFDDPRVGWLFEGEWIPASAVPLRPGHVILLRIWEETRPGNTLEPFNVAKLLVTDVRSDVVTLDWAYQIAPNNRELKPGAVEPGPQPRTREVRR